MVAPAWSVAAKDRIIVNLVPKWVHIADQVGCLPREFDQCNIDQSKDVLFRVSEWP